MTTDTESVNITKITSLTGTTVGKYRLEEPLGSGGMATVYRAVQSPLERTVAVKVLHPHLTSQTDFRERFLREAKAVASLRHDHIVQIYDYDVQDGICYIALEYLDGLSLEEKLHRMQEQNDEPTPLPVDQALEIGLEIADALSYAHQQRVIHRDIKPPNIMQTSAGRNVLSDFGIATVLHETRMTVDGGTSGTPSYMSPEQALGERGDERSDIYSLGAVLYQLVTGRLPFESDTLYSLIMMQVNDTPVPASDVNRQVPLVVAQIIQKAMAKDPEDRYQSADQLATDLQAALAGKSVKVTLPKEPEPEPVTKPERPKWMWVTGAAVALLMLVGIIWAATGLGQSTEETEPLVVVVTPTPRAAAAIEEEPDFTSSMAADPKSNQAYTDTFEKNSVGWPEDDGPVVRRVMGGEYQISVQMPDMAVSTVPGDLSLYNMFRYKLDVTLVDGQPESGYGIVFYRRNSNNYYVFAVNGLQQWSIWRLEDGQWQELRNLPDGQTWTNSDAVMPPGETNQLTLEAYGGDFNLFINGKSVGQVSDPNAPEAGGLIGMYVASSRTADDAFADARFDNVQLEPLDEFTIPSMAVEQ